MLDNLIFSLNGTVPLFVVMVLGYILFRVGFLTKEFIQVTNKFVFKVTLPALMFRDLAKVDIKADFDTSYVIFCVVTTLFSIAIVWGLSRLLIKNRSIIGEFVQGSYRSSAAVLGAAFIQNIYGDSGLSGLMIIGCVPLYNIFAVLILVLESPDKERNLNLGQTVKKSLKGIVTNPIILGVFFGSMAGLINLPIPPMADKTIASVASLTTPLALLAIGAEFKGRKALGQIKLATIASFIKLILWPALFLPLAVYLGFTGQKLVALIVMFGSITTPSSYIMAKNMGHEGTLTASICVLTTLISAFTLTFWLFLSKSLGWI